MNIALPTLAVFILLLPGFIARSRFKRSERTSLDFSPFGQVVSEAIIWAAVLHGLWIGIVSVFTPYAFQPLHLLQLISSDARAQSAAIGNIADHARPVGLYFGSLLVLAFVGPALFRGLIVRRRWDRIGARLSALCRFSGAPWYYLLTGADFADDEVPDLISISAVVDVAGQPFLYRGYLEEYFVDREGTLDRLVLSDVERRPLDRDKPADPSAADLNRFYTVDGDYFVLRYSEVITLNVKYLKLEVEPIPALSEPTPAGHGKP